MNIVITKKTDSSVVNGIKKVIHIPLPPPKEGKKNA
jgi:hypothetical protein